MARVKQGTAGGQHVGTWAQRQVPKPVVGVLGMVSVKELTELNGHETTSSFKK